MARAARDDPPFTSGDCSPTAASTAISTICWRCSKWRSSGGGNLAVHAVLDGRDKPPRSALPFIDQLEAKLKELGRGRIATVTGRYFAMDRDKRWDRIERACAPS